MSNNTEGLTALRDLVRQYERDKKIKIDACKTQYPLIRNVALQDMGWKLWRKQDQKGEVNVFWSDTYVNQEHVRRLRPYQRINHFPNSQELGKKNLLTENLKKMKTLFPNDYSFYPQTWSLPQEEEKLKEDENKNKWFIVKPTASSQGKGIYLVHGTNHLRNESLIVQEYITNPHLIDRSKYDLRIYVFIKSLSPLKIFKFSEGLTRLATEPYQSPNKQNRKKLNIHLTNYAINKLSPVYMSNKSINLDSEGHKRSLKSTYQNLKKNGCDLQKLDNQIQEIIIKTILASYSKLLESYKSCRDFDYQSQSVCFQILGFDILIDQNFKPWLLEVNHSPSFCTDSPLDQLVKTCLIKDTFVLLNLNSQEKQNYLKLKVKQQCQGDLLQIIKQKFAVKNKKNNDFVYQNSHLGGFSRIFPSENRKMQLIFNKITGKSFQIQKKLQSNLLQEKCKLDLSPVSLSPSPALCSPIKRKNKSFTFYGNFNFLIEQNNKSIDKYRQKSHQEQNNSFIFERNKKKLSTTAKIKSINIGFVDGMKTTYQNGFQTKNPSNNAHQPILQNLQTQFSLKLNSKQSKRCQFFDLNKEMKLKATNLKFARIKIKKMRSCEKRQEYLKKDFTSVMKGSEIGGQTIYVV